MRLLAPITFLALQVARAGVAFAQPAGAQPPADPTSDSSSASAGAAGQRQVDSTGEISGSGDQGPQPEPTVTEISAEWRAVSSDVSSFDPEAAVALVSVVSGPGVKIGEGTVVHAVLGALTGFVSNTFYASSAPKPAGVLRLLAQLSTGSLSPQRLANAGDGDGNSEAVSNIGALQYHADVRAAYDAMLSGNSAVAGTGGLSLGAAFHGIVNPSGNLSLGIDEDFSRLIRAANFESDANTDRDINAARLSLRYHPQTRSLSGELYYANTIDVFERSQQQFADRIIHQVGLRPMWQFLPVSQVYLDVSESIVGGLGTDSGKKVTSYPLIAKAGVATLLSLKTSLNAEVGYTNGFYSSGPSFSAPLVNLQLAYRYSPLGRAAIGYSLDHQDSINANYYRDHIIRGWVSQQVFPFVFVLQPELHFREYSGITLVAGPPTRDDVIVSIVAGVNYNFRDWVAATIGYRYTSVQTDYRYMVGPAVADPSYARHEALAGVRVAF